MFEIIFVILMALLCPNQTNTANCDNKGTQVTTLDDDTGGETGNPPPKPPTPPGGQP